MVDQLDRLGTVRTSQVLWNYGPGALIDLPNMSAVIMGLDLDIATDLPGWHEEYSHEINEPRLLNAVRNRLGPQIKGLRMPPIKRDGFTQQDAKRIPIGVPIEPFPRWLHCTVCNQLLFYADPGVKCWADWSHPEQSRFQHKTCSIYKGALAIPARLLIACSDGHLDDFPWTWYVHRGPSDCPGPLQLVEVGASIGTSNLMVSCLSCECKRPLAHALMGDGSVHLPACRGRHPHLGIYGRCTQPPKVLNLGASNLWFPVILSALDIPLSGPLPERSSTRTEIKLPEWQVLTQQVDPKAGPQFRAVPIDSPGAFAQLIDQVVLLERLREVNALIGFTRIDPPDESTGGDTDRMVALSRGKPTWAIAGEVYGEGIFIRFNEDAIQHWERSVTAQQRYAALERGHNQWCQARERPVRTGLVDLRYALIHTLSHVLIRELAFECGYNAASLKERIYAHGDEYHPMAGVLIYTAANDTDGTLGGLVELGYGKALGRVLAKALRRAMRCSADPLCADHQPALDGSLHLAACHSCTFLAETSCERGNTYLDRALLVPTLGDHVEAGFFTSLLHTT